MDQKPAFVDGLLELARRNAGVDILQVTPETLGDYLPSIPEKLFNIREMAHKADMIRAMLVMEHGGMWLDSDALVLRDLNPLFDHLEDAEFVGFNDKGQLQPGRPWVRVNCFLSKPAGAVVSQWVAAQHAKFPKVTYDWEEVGSALLHPICLSNAETVKILPFETICPVRWDQVSRFSSSLQSARSTLDDVMMIMLSNKALGDRNPEIKEMSVEQMRHQDTLLGQFVRRAYDPGYLPPTTAGLAISAVRKWVRRRLGGARFDNRP